MKAQMFNDQRWIEDKALAHNPANIRKMFDLRLNLSGFTVLAFTEHFFDPHGYTALWLLGESHLAIHTFPEEDKIYVEMSSCVEEPFKQYIMLADSYDSFTNKENHWP